MDANNFGHILGWWSAACVACYLLFLSLKFLRPDLMRIRFLWLHLGYIGARIFYGVMLSAGQYVHWAGNPFTRPLTYLPLPPSVPLPGLYGLFGPLLALRHGYFFDYMLSRYWMGFFWGLLTAIMLFLLLRAIRKYRRNVLSLLDINLFIAGSLLLSWPYSILFIFAVFVIFLAVVLIATIFRLGRMPLYPSIILGFLAIYFFGDRIGVLLPLIGMLKFERV